MLQTKKIVVSVLLLQLLVVSSALFAKQLGIRDTGVFNQAVTAMDEQNWQLAQSLLNGLHDQFPENIVIKNNLAVVLFNQGELQKSQDLFSAIIEQNKLTATAYKNLKKLYSYSAAKTYSKGLNLMKPIEMPELTVLSQDLDEKLLVQKADSKISSVTLAKAPVVITKTEPEQTEPAQTIADKTITKTEETKEIAAQQTPVEYISSDKQEPKEADQLVQDSTASDKTDKTIVEEVKQQDTVQQSRDTIKQPVNDEDMLMARLEQWRESWVSGNAEAYISMYRENYSPPGKSRKAWVKNRRSKVVPEKNIKVQVKQPRVFVNKTGLRANILFEQQYSSNNYSDRVQKRLYWIKANGQWFIERESIIKIM